MYPRTYSNDWNHLRDSSAFSAEPSRPGLVSGSWRPLDLLTSFAITDPNIVEQQAYCQGDWRCRQTAEPTHGRVKYSIRVEANSYSLHPSCRVMRNLRKKSALRED